MSTLAGILLLAAILVTVAWLGRPTVPAPGSVHEAPARDTSSIDRGMADEKRRRAQEAEEWRIRSIVNQVLQEQRP